MAEAAAVFDALLDACDALHKWECPPQVRAVLCVGRQAVRRTQLLPAGRFAAVAPASDCSRPPPPTPTPTPPFPLCRQTW